MSEETDIDEVVIEKFKECYDIFLKEALDGDGVPIACTIHDAFGFLGENHHNCLGCNFADSTTFIENYLKKHEELTDIHQDFTVYILLLYLMVERMSTVLDIVQVPSKYRDKHFKVFQQVRKWANFIKHPKSFILTHHPVYDFENSEFEYELDFNIEINEAFVQQYYKGESNPEKQKKLNLELYKKLKNQQNVKVVFPDIAKMTKKMCYSIKKFVDLISKNDVYIEILSDDTTVETFFEQEDSNINLKENED